MSKRLRFKLGQLNTEESALVSYLFLFAFCTGIFVSFYNTLANALFLNDAIGLGVEKLPYGYIASGLLGLVFIRFFNYLQAKVKLKSVFSGIFIFIIFIMLFGHWTGTSFENTQIQKINAITLFVISAPLLTFMSIITNGLAFHLFNLRQTKRLYSLSNVGGTISSILGYLLIPIVKQWLPDYDLLFFAAFGAFGALLTLRIIFNKFEDKFKVTKKAVNLPKEKPKISFFKNRYYLLIASFVLLSSITAFFVDFGFLEGVTLLSSYTNAEKVSIIAIAFMIGKSGEFLFSLLSGRIIIAKGLKFSLTLLPLSILAITAITIVIISFSTNSSEGELIDLLIILSIFLIFKKLLYRIIRRSVDQPATRTLFQPMPKSERVMLQSTIEGSASFLGTVAAGGILLILGSLNPLESGDIINEIAHVRIFSWWLLLILIPWSIIMYMVYQRYRNKLADAIQFNQISADDGKSALTVDEAVEQHSANTSFVLENNNLLQAINYPVYDAVKNNSAMSQTTGNQRELLTLLNKEKSPVEKNRLLLEAAKQKNKVIKNYLIELLSIPAHSPFASTAIPLYKDEIIPELNALFLKTTDLRIRIKIIKIFKQINTERAIEGLFQLINYSTPAVQFQAIAAIHDIDNHVLSQNQKAIVDAKVNEYASHVVWVFRTVYDLKNYPEAASLVSLLMEQAERLKKSILHLLGLLYGSDKSTLIEKTLENKNNLENRILALEIIDNFVEKHIKDIVMPIFDDISIRRKLSILEKHIPQQRFKPSLKLESRLKDIIIRNHMKTGLMAKVAAINIINNLDIHDKNSMTNVALSHHHPLIFEAAAIAMFEQNAEKTGAFVQQPIGNIKKKEILFILEQQNYKKQSLQYKIEKLKASRLFNNNETESLFHLALSMTKVSIKKGTQIYLNDFLHSNNLWLVDSGELKAYLEDQQFLTITTDDFILERVYPAAVIQYFEAVEDTECFTLKQDLFFDFLSDSLVMENVS